MSRHAWRQFDCGLFCSSFRAPALSWPSARCGRPARAPQTPNPSAALNPRIPDGDDWFDIFRHVAKCCRGHSDFVALHPVEIALERVDLSVMGQHAEGLCQPPLRERYWSNSAGDKSQSAFETLIHQVGVENRNLFGQHHPFVDDRAAGQRRRYKAPAPEPQPRLFQSGGG